MSHDPMPLDPPVTPAQARDYIGGLQRDGQRLAAENALLRNEVLRLREALEEVESELSAEDMRRVARKYLSSPLDMVP